MPSNWNYEVSTITVYRDDPIWSNGKRWFQHPEEKLADLHVATYEVRGEFVGISEVQRHAKEVALQHPGCVLVHI